MLSRPAEESRYGVDEVLDIGPGLGIFLRVEGIQEVLKATGYVVTTSGCPYQGMISQQKMEFIVDEYEALGVNGIALGDKTGMANPV